MSQEKFEVIIKRYVVAFIDVMGQKNSLSKIDPCWDANVPDDEMRQLFKETYGYVTDFQTALNDFFETVNNLVCPVSASSNNANEIPFPYQTFSDSYLIYFPLDCHNVMKRIEALLLGLHSVWLDCLSKKIPIRGAIDIGACAPMYRTQGIYGGGVYKAVYLESEYADWPRIIIGPSLKKFITNSEITSLIQSEFAPDNSRDCIDIGFLKAKPLQQYEFKMLEKIADFCNAQVQSNKNDTIVEKYRKLLAHIKKYQQD